MLLLILLRSPRDALRKRYKIVLIHHATVGEAPPIMRVSSANCEWFRPFVSLMN